MILIAIKVQTFMAVEQILLTKNDGFMSEIWK